MAEPGILQLQNEYYNTWLPDLGGSDEISAM